MRRRGLVAAGAAGMAGAAIVAPAIAQQRLRWTMVMPWPKNTPGVGVNAERFARRVEAMSGGRIEIRLYGAGELVPPFEVLDAVQRGTADLAHGTPYYFVGKAPALNYFTGVPFGLMAHELAAWFYFGDGLALWRETYAPFGVVPFYAGSSGVQAGGWFRKEIATVADLQGLKFRIAGLGGDAMRRLGVVTVQTPPGEIGPALLSGAIDAAEWIGPWNDRAFGLFKSARYYYTPAFHEPGPGLEIILNKAVWDGLPADLQAIVETAASATANETYADFVWHNIQSLDPLVRENDVQLRTFSDEIVVALAKATRQSFEELAAKDGQARKVHDSVIAFLARAVPYYTRFDGRMQQMREIFTAQA
jgi:TRAP-type mannitol/chloroaromatic compound transport system substrate-binding protein